MMKLQSASKLRRHVATLRPVVLALISAGCMSAALAGPWTVDPNAVPTAQDISRVATSNPSSVVNVTTVGSTTTIFQAAKYDAYNVSRFGIGSNATMQIKADDASGATLLRGIGLSTVINGTFTANNHVLIINPFGIYVGGGANINTASLMMSTKDVNDFDSFVKNGHVVFNTNAPEYGDSTIQIDPGAKLTATDGGSILLLADNVRNYGSLSVGKGGSVVLAAAASGEYTVGDSGFITLTGGDDQVARTVINGVTEGSTAADKITVADGANGQVRLEAYGLKSQAINEGTIGAPNSTVLLATVGANSSVSNKGKIDAPNKAVSLTATGANSSVTNTGTIDAANSTVLLTTAGANSLVTNKGSIDAPDSTVSLTATGANSSVTNMGTVGASNSTVSLTTAGTSSSVTNSGTIDASNSTVLLATVGTNSSVTNSGKITATGGQGKVRLEARGIGTLAANFGTIDVSALEGQGLTVGGSIAMSAENILVGDTNGRRGDLLANGPGGGGTIDLGDTARAEDDTTNTKWIYVSGATNSNETSTLSARATDTGNGGTINLRAMYAADPSSVDGTPRVRYEYGQVEAYGDFIAQGGKNGGSGGTVAIGAQSINLSYNGMKGRFQVAPLNLRPGIDTNGSVSFEAPYLNIGYDGRGDGGGYGGHFEATNGESWIDPDVITETLSGGADVSLSASGGTFFGVSYLRVRSGSLIGSTGKGLRTLVLQSENALEIYSRTSITASEGPLDLQLIAQNGGLSLFSGEGESFPTTIMTNGGSLTMNGAIAPFSESGSAGVYVSGANIDTRGAKDAPGLLTITGTGAEQNGVQIEGGSKLSGTHVLITGVSQTGTGVAMSNTEVTGVTGIEVHGLSQQGAPLPSVERSENNFASAAAMSQAAAQQVSTGPAGVDIGPNVTFNLGQGRATILGRSASGDGVRIQDLTVTTTALGAARARLTIAGESVSGGMGVNVLADSGGIQMHEQGGNDLASADVVIGGTAAGIQDIELGNPDWHTTGSVNIRPLGVNVNGESLEMAERVDRAIHVGTAQSAQQGDFLIKPEWFNPSANDQILGNTNFVIGSSGQVGKITVADKALDGAGSVTLQNQGLNSGGIQLGAQTSMMQNLNLVTTGNITQTGPIMVNGLRIIPGTTSRVALNSVQNLIKSVSFNNQPPAVAPEGVASSASLANTGAAGILSYNSNTNQFEELRIEQAPVTPTSVYQYDPQIPRPFEGPDALNDLRTDIYVHGQLSRPQICTPANTSGSATGAQGGVEPLALEWLKVKRSAQLSNCSGVQTDSSCSAF